MKAYVNLSHPKIQCLHQAVAIVCNVSEGTITVMADTEAKKIAVFILAHYYGYKPKDITIPYRISYLYVPTVVDQCIILYGMSENFRKKVHFILDYIERYYDEKAA